MVGAEIQLCPIKHPLRTLLPHPASHLAPAVSSRSFSHALHEETHPERIQAAPGLEEEKQFQGTFSGSAPGSKEAPPPSLRGPCSLPHSPPEPRGGGWQGSGRGRTEDAERG